MKTIVNLLLQGLLSDTLFNINLTLKIDSNLKHYTFKNIYLQIFNVNCPTESFSWDCLNLVFTEITKKNNNKKDHVREYYLKIILIQMFEKL